MTPKHSEIFTPAGEGQDDMMTDAGQNEAANTSATRVTNSRHIDLSFEQLESEDPIADNIDSVLAPFFEKCLALDSEFRILPWSEVDPSGKTTALDALACADDIPRLFTTLKRYFCNFQERYEGGRQHVSLWITSVLPFQHFRENLGSWLKHNKMGIYDRVLQVEQATTVGFLLYSSQQINRDILQAELSRRLGFQVECRWRKIRAEWNEAIPKQYEVSAIHVLVE
jgi:hypothetical protein